MNLRSLLLIGSLGLSLTGCTLMQHTLATLLPAPWTQNEQQLDQRHQQSMNMYLNSANILRLGTHLCRSLPTGIVGQDWIQGNVVGYKIAKVAIKIADAGHEPHELQGSVITLGQVIWDEGSLWIPCQ